MDDGRPTDPQPSSRPDDGSNDLEYQPMTAEDEAFMNSLVEEYERLWKQQTQSWDKESLKYEETMEVEVQGEKALVPRRNYANPDACIQDSSLFPYHVSCYPLLDAYDSLYISEYGEITEPQPIPQNAILPHQGLPIHPSVEENGIRRSLYDSFQSLLCDPRSVLFCLFRGHLPPFVDVDLDNFPPSFGNLMNAFLAARAREQEGDLFLKMQGEIDSDLAENLWIPATVAADPTPKSPTERRELWLRLLQHSLSDLQRDFTLATALVTRLAMDHAWNDIPTFQRFLVLLSIHYVPCGIPCFETPDDHDCNTWSHFLQIIPRALYHGADAFTRQHAMAVLAFFRFLLEREFGHLLGTDTGSDTNALRKLNLKRTVLANRMVAEDDYHPDPASPDRILLCVLQSLGIWAEKALMRMAILGESGAVSAESIESYHNSMLTLVTTSSMMCSMIPKSPRLYQLASAATKFIAAGLLVRPTWTSLAQIPNDEDADYLGNPTPEQGNAFPSFLTSPFRLADSVTKATARAQEEVETLRNARVRLTSDEAFYSYKAVHGRPHDDIRLVVRDMFAWDLIFVERIGFGFIDFLLWCRFEDAICGDKGDYFDPTVFWMECNFLSMEEDGSEDQSEVDEDEWERPGDWAIDEDGNTMTTGELQSRLHFALLALVVAWNASWTPESHGSFPAPFRDAVKTLALCTRRQNMPIEVCNHIASFLPRQGWYVSRKTGHTEGPCCWQYDCRARTLALQRDAVSYTPVTPPPPEEKPKVLTLCKGCGVTAYCSRTCKTADYKDGHKKWCGRPPFCYIQKEHVSFCNLVRDHIDDPQTALRLWESDFVPLASVDEEDKTVGDGDDDDESWESVESDEEEVNTDGRSALSKLLFQYFRKHTYSKRSG